MIEDLVTPILKDPSAHMSTLKYRIPLGEDVDNPNQVKVVTDTQGYALYFSRYPIPFSRDGVDNRNLHYRHLSFYAYRTDFLKRFNRLKPGPLESAEKLKQSRALEYGFKIRLQEPRHNSSGVDVPEDIRPIERAMRAGQATKRQPHDP